MNGGEMPNSVAKHLAKPVLSWGRNAVPGILIFHFPLADSWAPNPQGFQPTKGQEQMREGGFLFNAVFLFSF